MALAAGVTSNAFMRLEPLVREGCGRGGVGDKERMRLGKQHGLLLPQQQTAVKTAVSRPGRPGDGYW